MSENWYPVIITDSCTNSCTNYRKCSDICTSNVFEVDSMKVRVVYPEECIVECIKCKSLCYEGALLYELNCEVKINEGVSLI